MFTHMHTESVRVIESISDVAVRPGGNALFTCTAVGVPQPLMRWFVGELEVQGDPVSVEPSSSTFTVQSQLAMQSVTTDQMGAITCVAYHTLRNGEILMSPARASLIVLSE